MKIDKKGYKGDSLGMLLLIGFLTGIAATICGIMNLSVTKREEIAERDFIRTGGLNIMCITLLLLGMYKIHTGWLSQKWTNLSRVLFFQRKCEVNHKIFPHNL